ncbi:hypothetical protein Holit_01884 [Hollandina sp. SP2]
MKEEIPEDEGGHGLVRAAEVQKGGILSIPRGCQILPCLELPWVYAIVDTQGFRETRLQTPLEIHEIFRICGQSKIVKHKIVKLLPFSRNVPFS